MRERLVEPFRDSVAEALVALLCYLVLLVCGWSLDHLLVPAEEA